MKVVADAKIPFLKGVLESHADVVYLDGHRITAADVRDADALIVRTRTRCNAALLDGSAVRFIATATIGFDHIDTAYCGSRGIHWTNAEGCNSASVHQYIASALYALADRFQFTLADLTIGIVGVGNVGSKVARLAGAIGMRVLLNDPPRARREGSAGFVALDDIMREADLITFHVPLNMDGVDRTYHIGDGRFFSQLARKPIIINSSRGEVLAAEAVKSALRMGSISTAVLDVWENEPGIDLDLLHAAAIGTPHIAGYSADGKANGTSMSVQALSRFFHLGIDTWRPGDIPAPAAPVIDCDCRGRGTQEITARLVRATYDILSDDQRLRESPSTFEQQRGAYPVRREFPAYSIRFRNATIGMETLAREIGFVIAS